MKSKIIIVVVILILVALAYGLVLHFGKSDATQNITATDGEQNLADSPDNTTYLMDSEGMTLKDGISEIEAAPGSASKIITRIFGEPTSGDINGDGIPDASVILVREGGGSGTFYYAAAAININGRYKGTNTVFLGDRIAPQTTEIKDEVVRVNYADRKPSESMSTVPSIGVTKYIVYKNEMFQEIAQLGVGDSVLSGNLVMSEGNREFKSCTEKEGYWVIGSSTAYKSLMNAYGEYIAQGAKSYDPLYVVLSGTIVSPPRGGFDGFGSDYKFGIVAKELIEVLPKSSCQ